MGRQTNDCSIFFRQNHFHAGLVRPWILFTPKPQNNWLAAQKRLERKEKLGRRPGRRRSERPPAKMPVNQLQNHLVQRPQRSARHLVNLEVSQKAEGRELQRMQWAWYGTRD